MINTEKKAAAKFIMNTDFLPLNELGINSADYSKDAIGAKIPPSINTYELLQIIDHHTNGDSKAAIESSTKGQYFIIEPSKLSEARANIRADRQVGNRNIDDSAIKGVS